MVVEENNPRMVIRETELERTLRYVELIGERDLDEGVCSVFLLLGDCLLEGSRREDPSSSLRQLMYIIRLARLDEEQLCQFCSVVDDAGGMDSRQAHHLINGLLERRP